MSLVIEATAQSPARRANSPPSALRKGRKTSRSVSILTIAPALPGYPACGNPRAERAGAASASLPLLLGALVLGPIVLGPIVLGRIEFGPLYLGHCIYAHMVVSPSPVS